MTYQPKVYRKDGGDTQVVAAGGALAMEPGSFIQWANPTGAADYFVDGNVSATGSGTIDSPFSTLAEAIAASNTSIALTANRWWARRNRIFCMGDTLTEDLTQLPTKCDVIGLGSYDGNSKCGLYGHHSTAAEAYGTRWVNMHFKAKAHASAIFTLAGATSASGQEFYGSTFDATLGTVTSAILSTAMPGLKVVGCEMYGAFATSYISFGAGEAGKALIQGNKMSGSLGKGVILAGTTTASWEMFLIENFIKTVGIWVDDDADILHVINNRAVTEVDCATYTAGFDMNLLLASGNLQTGSNAGDCDSVPHVLFA
jgi:hypothetical protein